MGSDKDRGREAVEDVLEAFYGAIGTPAPAPGIERLAIIATEAARKGLWAEWEEEILDDGPIELLRHELDRLLREQNGKMEIDPFRDILRAALARVIADG